MGGHSLGLAGEWKHKLLFLTRPLANCNGRPASCLPCSQIGSIEPPTLGASPSVQVVALRTLERYWTRKGNEKAEKPLRGWYTLALAARWGSTVEVRQSFPQTDFRPKGWAIFDVGGNKFRIVARIDYPNGVMFIHEVLDHREYDAWLKTKPF